MMLCRNVLSVNQWLSSLSLCGSCRKPGAICSAGRQDAMAWEWGGYHTSRWQLPDPAECSLCTTALRPRWVKHVLGPGRGTVVIIVWKTTMTAYAIDDETYISMCLLNSTLKPNLSCLRWRLMDQFEILQEVMLQARSVLPSLMNSSWRPTGVVQAVISD